jgi:hypothetical protein
LRDLLRTVGIKMDSMETSLGLTLSFDDGLFVAYVLEPFASATQDTYDFDTNLMYIKKDHLNSIGLKIPLHYKSKFDNSEKRIEIDELIDNCVQR